MSKRIIGFLNLFDSPSIGELTENRTLASTSFLGRFAIMDFALSNFTNSGIDEFSILVKNNFRSVAKHVGSLKAWVNNTKRGRQNILVNEKAIFMPKRNIDVNCIRQNDWVLLDSKADYVVIQPAHIVMNFDLRPFIDEHIESGADVSIAYKKIDDADKTFIEANVVSVKNGEITNIKKNNRKTKSACVSLNTYVMSRLVLKRLLDDPELQGLSLDKLLKKACTNKMIKLHAYRFDGYARAFDSQQAFINNSFELFDNNIARILFNSEWPIYTLSHDTPPCVYGVNAKVCNSFVANGAVIDGSVDSSIISRRCKVNKGAKVKSSIVLTSSVIEEGAIVEHALIDKYARILAGAVVKGTKENPIYIQQGKCVK